MNKQKSIFVTILVAALLIVIMIGAWINRSALFDIIGLLFAAYGFAIGARNFCRWLGKETPLLPARTRQNEEWEPDEEFLSTYDEIKRELEAEG